MELIDQQSSIDASRLKGRDTPRFWRVPVYDGLECLDACFHHHTYTPHRHETYAFGVVSRGVEAYHVDGVKYYAGPGNFCLINPEALHDGAPYTEGGYRYHMIYPSVAFINRLAEDIFGKPVNGTFSFRRGIGYDRELASSFRRLHGMLPTQHQSLRRDEAMLGVIGQVLTRFADAGGLRDTGKEAGPVAQMKNYLEAHHAEDVTLDELARLTGLNRHYLIRAFKKATGMTPHKYLVDCRVRAARKLLREGVAISEAALISGFYDQSHMSHAFKAAIGVTPGAYIGLRN